jgi:hypothetical protein
LAEYRMGPAKWTYDSIVQDFLTRGTKVTITPIYKEMKFDQTGDTPYDDLLTGATIEVEMVVAVKKPEDIAKFISWANKIVDGTKVLIDGVINIGKSMRDIAKPFLLHPVDFADDDVSNDVYIPKAVCISPFEKIFNGTDEDVFTSRWKGYIDSIEAKRLFQIGDRTVSADTTPPTVSSTLPAAAATGVAKASGLTIDFVMSEPLNETSVVKSNVAFFKTTDVTDFTGFNVTYISALKTIRLTTTVALAVSTEYCIKLSTGIKDANGNALAAPYSLKFTTGT